MQGTPRATTLNIAGRITSTSRARFGYSLLLTGRVNTQARAQFGYSLPLGGFINTNARGLSRLLFEAPVGTVLLTGYATTTSRSRLRPFIQSFVLDRNLRGNIKVTSFNTINYTASIVSGVLSGQVRTFVQARSTTIVPAPSILTGQIRTTTTARFSSLPTRDLVGLIRLTTWAGISQANERLSASIYTSSGLSVDSLQLQTLLTGQITTSSWVTLPPTQAVLFGRIQSNTYGIIPQLPLLPQFQPVVCPIDVDLDDYIKLITSEHIGKPKYLQTVTNTVQPYVEDQKAVNAFPCLFDVDVAVGEQEDFTGQWIGKSRYVNLGNVFFSFDVQGLGWDEANWRGPFDPPNQLAVLDDEHYRLLLYATIVANHWDGSVPTAYRAWDTLFAGTGYQVVIQDFGNMTMMLGLRGTGTIDVVTQALFSNGNMDLKPEGVALIDYVFQAQPGVPFFAFDASTDAVNGWDIGYWGHLVPPGQGFIPVATEDDFEEGNIEL